MASRQLILIFSFIAITAGVPLLADDQVDYLTQIKPILAAKCYSCHGAIKQEADLRLETRELMLTGGDSGELFESGAADESLLLERIAGDEDTRMPPVDEGSALKPAEIELLKKWIDQGAPAPVEEIPQAPSDHWSFQIIQKLQLPAGTDAIENPIDAFLEAKRLQKNLTPQPVAERGVLLRRLYLDLIGLPPTLVQLQDQRSWEEIVDELLQSPHHGERWARHWMDVWRYTDWYGLGDQLRYSQKHIWHWRDWIVESLNADKPFDRMIQEMIAGDELAPEDPQVLRATGYLARNYFLFNRTTWLDSTIEHTGKAFLGLTLNCAKCHDHKYDPITQRDYYRLRAIFEPHQVRLDPVPGTTDFEEDGLPRVFDDHLDIETFLHVRGDPNNPDKENPIEPGVPELLADFAPQIEPITLPISAYAPGVRDYVQQDRLSAVKAKIETAQSELDTANQQLIAARQAAEASESSTSTAFDFEVNDQFDQPNPDLWEIKGAGWKYQDGTLQQTVATREPQQVRLLRKLPSDFQIICHYTTTGGATYKSVTFRFDQNEDDTYSNMVYTSAHEPAPKVQVALTRQGKTAYPPEGRVAKSIEVGKSYQLKFAVRGTLVNIWLNDEFQLAFQLPNRQPEGIFSLSAFDATVGFDSIKITSLSDDVLLTEPGSQPPPNIETAEKSFQLNEAKLAAATASLASLQATIAADKGAYLDQLDENAQKLLATTAAKLQAEADRATAEYELLAFADDSKKRDAAQSQLKKAEKQLAQLAEGKHVDYSSLRASRKALETPAHKEPDYPATYPSSSTGRRLALARWLTSPKNPLTARVAVNQVWMRHFGQPLVETVFDFGLRCKKPVQSDLLDYLAAEFIESGWSFRHLHRLIVTSAAYQLSSSSANANPETLTTDPTNQYYWRMNSRRMESQLVRDSLLQLAGVLDPQLGGPSIDPSQASARRSLYFKHSRDQQDKFLTMFDDADLLQCYRRSESIVPQQALALANSKLALTMAEKIATKISTDNPAADRNQFIDIAYETLFARLPSEDDRRECQTFCQEMTELFATEAAPQLESRIRTRLVHAFLNHNDFISIR